MAKLAKRGNASSNVVLAAGNAQAHQMFQGLTLAQIGAKFDLYDEDVEWYTGTNPKTGETIRSILITVAGVVYQIPISRKLTEEIMNDFDLLPHCMVRLTNKSVKVADAQGNMVPKLNADGTPSLTTEPYISLGRPQGIVLVDTQRVGAFEGAPVIEDEPAHA